MKKIDLLIIITLFYTTLPAQHITLDLPANAGRKAVLELKHGTKTDTIYQGFLDGNGRAVVAVPAEYRNYKGFAELRTDRMGSYFEFIVAGEDVSVYCEEEYQHGGNVMFTNSVENEHLQKWFISQSLRQQKIALLSSLQQVYTKDEPLYALLEKERMELEKEQSGFEKELAGSPLYAARFLEMRNFLMQDISDLLFADSLKMSRVREFIRDSLDTKILFTSGLWFDILNGSLALYDNKAPYHHDFIRDMSELLTRSDDMVYMSLAESLFAICESTGWNDLEEELAYFLINDGRIENPTGKLQMLMALFKISKGSRVPELSFGALPPGKTLLVFYESGCGPCENEMQQLKYNYPLLKEKGYHIISVSADTDADVFRNTAGTYPWESKYCDYQGFSGTDFRNFGVIGTPTFYVIEEGVLKGRYARFEDTEIVNQNKP